MGIKSDREIKESLIECLTFVLFPCLDKYAFFMTWRPRFEFLRGRVPLGVGAG